MPLLDLNATSNTDQITSADRAIVGKQPDGSTPTGEPITGGATPTGPAGQDLSGTYPNPFVDRARGLLETSGPDTLAMGAVIDGQVLRRVGLTIQSSPAYIGVPNSGPQYGRLRKDISGTIASNADESWAPQPVYNAVDYGARADFVFGGSAGTDNSAAVNAAIAAMPATGGTLYFPDGYFRIASTISTSVPVAIVGNGVNRTQLIKSTTGTLFHLTPDATYKNTSYRSVELSDIALVTTVDQVGATGEAYFVDASLDAGNSAPTVVVNNVNVRAYPTSVGSWYRGVHLKNCQQAKVSKIEWEALDTTTGAAIYLDNQCTDSHVHDCNLIGGGTAIEASGVCEGFIVEQVTCVAQAYGVKSGNNGPKIFNSYFACYTRCIYHTSDAWQIAGCLLNDADANTGFIPIEADRAGGSCDEGILSDTIVLISFTGRSPKLEALVKLNGATKAIVSNCILNASGDATNAIEIVHNSAPIAEIPLIYGTLFSQMTNGVNIGAGVVGTTVVGTTCKFDSVTNPVVDAGTSTRFITTRNINGVSFDGTADITVTAAAGTLTGSTLASGVTASSLTSLGTLSALTVSGLAVLGRLQLNQGGSGTGLAIDTFYPVPLSITFAGGAPTENFDVNISAANFTTKPNWGIVLSVDPHYNGTFLVADAGNSTTTAKCQYYHNDGTNIPNSTKLLFGLFAYLSNT